MHIHEELIHRLSSKSRIRALLKEVSLPDMEKILQRLNDIHTEKLQRNEQEEKQRQQRREHIATIQQELVSLGLTISDLDTLPASGKKPRKGAKHRFKYTTATGEEAFWCGSITGRVPKAFQQYLDKHHKKRADCIVE